VTAIEVPRAAAGVPRPRVIGADQGRDDRVFRGAVRTVAFGTLVLLILIGVFLFLRGWHALDLAGTHFFTNSGFPATLARHPVYGVAASLYGTVVVAVVALVVGVPVALTTALFLAEFAPSWSKRTLVALVDLAAAIPSIIYGLWGFFELMPNEFGVTTWMARHLAFIPIFRVVSPPADGSLFIAGTVVGIMIVPIITSICREVFSLVPPGEREAALALGASRAQMIRTVVFPFARGGIIGAVMLGLGRALGETIAVAIILAFSLGISPHILQHGGSTIATLITTYFGAGGKLGTSVLLMAGFVLFVLTMVVNLAASAVVNRSRSGSGVEL
jgi:phosphate transport system permease protein